MTGEHYQDYLDGMSYSDIARKYGVNRVSTVYQSLKRYADRHSLTFPVPRDHQTWRENKRKGAMRHLVSTHGVAFTIEYYCRENDLSVWRFCRDNHLWPDFVYKILREQQQFCSRAYAIKIYKICGEPIPSSLRQTPGVVQQRKKKMVS